MRTQGLSKVFFLFPSPPQKRVKERVAALARERQSGNTLLLNLGWGACCQSERLLRGPAGGQAKSSSKRGLRLLVYNELYLRQCKGVRTPCRKDELCYE